MLRERSVQIKSAVESCEPGPGQGFCIELDHLNRTDGTNNMKAAYPIVVRVNGEAGFKKTVTGPGIHWVDGGFTKLDILDGPSGAYFRCSVADSRADGIDVVREPPMYYGDPAFLGERGLGPTPVMMLAGRVDSDPLRGQAAVWRASVEGVPLLGLSFNGTATPLRTDDYGSLLTTPQPVKLAELTSASAGYSDAVFNNGSRWVKGLGSWSDNPDEDCIDVGSYRAVLYEFNGGVTDHGTGLTIAPFVELYAAQPSESGGSSSPFAKLFLTAGADFLSSSISAAFKVGEGCTDTTGTNLLTRGMRPRLVKFGFTVSGGTAGGTAMGSFRARGWGLY